MEKLIYNLAMCRSKKLLTNKYSADWFREFGKESKKRFNEILPRVPDIGNSIFSFNYKFAPAFIAWYLTLEKMGLSRNEIDETIWILNERLVKTIPPFLMKKVGKIYLGSFRRKAELHEKKQHANGLHPYDWQIEYRDVNENCFEIDIKACGIKKLAEDFNADGLLPGICRMDYLFANIMGNGFERTKTLGDGDDCCNCRYFMKGNCEWSPEKGFVDRK